ncbi:MAG: lytic transglycosylase domain-containing protein [Pseudonocardiaceae bacterium]
MTLQDTGDHPPEPRLPVHGRRTRVVVALIGFLFSLGVPVVVLGGGPVPTVDGHAVGALDDPAGLGVTGTLSAYPLAAYPLTADPSTAGVVPLAAPSGVSDGVPGDSAGAGLPGIPTPGNLPDEPLGIPGVVLDAYQFAQRTLAATGPGCHLSWPVLAGIGRIESGHASGGRVDAFGNTLGPILGPRLDGSPGMAAIVDTDHGQLDGDPVWDRAVGPMQFIQSTWRAYGVDGNGDGVANPNNIYDATIATGLYLCAGGADLSDLAHLRAAVFRYNHSAAYVDIVLQWAQAYLTGVVPTPSAPGPVPPGTNGNGGRTIVTGGAPLAAVAPAPVALVPPVALIAPVIPITQPTPLAPPRPQTTSSPPPEPSATTTTPPPPTSAPVTTSTSPPPVTTTVLPIPPATEPSPSPPTPSSSPPPTTTPPPTTVSTPPPG